MKKTKLLNVPNVLTAVRILMIPAFVLAYLKIPEKKWIALVIYATAGLTDAVDGYIARRYNQTTWFGKLFDPLADKFMAISMLTCLVADGIISWLMLAVMVAKELYMIIGSSFLFRKHYVVKSNYMGKLATMLFILSSCLVIPWHGNENVTYIGNQILLISIGLSIAAAVNYTFLAKKESCEKRED